MATCLSCTDCSSGAGSISLNCDKHYICEKCFLSRGKRKVKAQKCAICESAGSLSADPPVPAAKHELGIWIYVDNSNLWIEAKKVAAQERGLITAEDPRVRIDIGKLTEVVAKGRRVERGIVYGSEPPKVDTVWKKIEEHPEWEVKTKRRSHITGKEKKVDTQLTADVVLKTCEIPPEKRSTIVLITGDADMLPAIEQVQKCEGWSVEVYSWKQALSSDFRDLSSTVSRIFPLDPHLKEITFTNRKFNLHTEKQQSLSKLGIVFSMRRGMFQREGEPTEEWCEQVESIAKWPFQYCWLEEHNNDLLLVFMHIHAHKKFDVNKFMDTMIKERQYAYLRINYFQTYAQYSRSDEEPWQFVQPRRKLKQWREHCDQTKDDDDLHTAELEKSNPEHSQKTKLCRFYPNCRKTKEDCRFAHGKNDALCSECYKRGHFSEKCRKKK